MKNVKINFQLALLGVAALFLFGRTYDKVADKIDELHAQKTH